MENAIKIRYGWLKAMYLYTLVTAGGLGFAMLFFPGRLQLLLHFPAQDPVTFTLYGSIVLAAGLIAVPALFFPLKFVPLLLLQLVYKPVWIVVTAIPIFMKGEWPPHVVLITVVFLIYIVGDLIAIPFPYLFSKDGTARPAG